MHVDHCERARAGAERAAHGHADPTCADVEAEHGAVAVGCSCVPGVIGQVGEVDADAARRGLPARFQRQGEQQLGIGRRRQPVVLGEFVFELARTPAGAAQRDDGVRPGLRRAPSLRGCRARWSGTGIR